MDYQEYTHTITQKDMQEIIKYLSEEDYEYVCEFRMVHLTNLFQKIIEVERNKEKKTFDEFVNDALRYYILYLLEKRREEKCGTIKKENEHNQIKKQ